MREALQVELPLTRLFGEPTLAGQGEAIAAIVERRGVQALPAIGRVSRAGPLLMSFGQQRLWFLAKLGASATYHIPMVLRLRGLLEASALRKSLDRLVWRHESLRSVFVMEEGEPRVRLLPAESGFSLVEEDLEHAPDAGERLEAMSREEAEAPFDLERGPLLRGRLIRLGPEEHLLLLTQHHIVSDGWSMGVFTRELGALYEAYASGKEDPLPALEIEYPDYAAWQRAWLTGERLEAQAAYWRENLSGAPERLELPTDRPRPKEQSFVGGFVGLRLDRELTRGLKRVSQEQGGTLLMTVLSAWSMVLSRLSGQEEVVIGIPTANRGRREMEGLIGFFVNTLALRIDVSGEPSVVELVSRVRKTALLAQEHQDLPFEQVVEIVSPPRRLDQSPVFQVMCTMEQGEGGGFALGGLKVEPAGAPSQTVKFDVELSLGEVDDIIVGGLRYAKALFDGGTIERHGGYLEAALHALVRDPGRRVGEVELLSPSERKLLLETWNETAAPYPRERCIHELFEEQVRRAPEVVALVQGEEEVSYGELNRRANRLAHQLIEKGVGPDVRVALCVERSPPMVVALLGILKAGGAYVPLDPSYPSARLAELVQDAAPLLAVCDAAGCKKVREDSAGVPVLVLEDTYGEPGAELETDPTVASLTSAHLAYVIYTSGSSGKPKAVLVEHRSVMNYVVWARAAYAPEAGGVVTSSLSFDATVTSLITPLVCGGAVRLTASVEDADGLHAELRGMDGWLAKMTPSHLGSLGQVLARTSSATSLGVVVIGGEALSPSITRMWRQIQPGVRLVNEYGPTETVVGCTVYEVPERMEDGGAIPIGSPIANARIYVLDGYGQPVPQGAVGEIHIGGAGVARGYLNRPELTSERFMADPHSPEPGARMYRTGDLARYLPDGNLEFLGRWDHQVKVRGYRIELGEIEARLLEHPWVRDAVVVSREGAEGDTRLVAYVTTRPEGGEGEASELVSSLRSHLARQLPEYMVPSAVLRLEALPLTRNGKLDRKALPAPDGESVVKRRYEAPQGEIEETLSRLWSELLGVERVGRQDHFFELGGHSLLAVRLLSRVREALQVDLPLTRLFEEPTLAGQKEAIAAIVESRGVQALPAIGRVSREGSLVLSFAQQRLWFLAKLGASATYHMPMGLRLGGRLEASALRKSLDRLVWRHESLRSVFVMGEGEPRVRLLPAESGFSLVEEDLEHTPDAGERLEAMSREEAEAPFDLERGPLLRGRLIRLGPEEHVLLLTQHHIVSDGWSMGVFTRELGALYEAYASGKEDPLPALEIQYPDYAAWQRAWLTGERLEAQAAYWRENLSGAPERLELPTDRPRPKEQSFVGGFVGLRLDRELTRGLKRISQEQGGTLLMTVLSAWSMVLSRLSGQEEVVIGIPTANRGRREVEGLIGFFVNTLALRIDVSGEPSVVELVSRVRKTALLAQEHQDLPFEQVVEMVSPPRRLDQSPVFQVMCTLEQGEREGFALGELKVEPSGTPSQTVKFDVELSLGEVDGIIVGGLRYAAALFDGGTIERHGGYLEAALHSLVTDRGRRVGEVELLSPTERKLVLETWNETAVAYPRERCIHELFEEQARRSPEAVALVQGEEEVSYGELNRRANRLAHRLIEHGVGPDVRVALCVERSPSMVVALLGILKAGGAYVPLDPSYPSARLAELVQDAAPLLAVCDAAGSAALSGEAIGQSSVFALEEALFAEREGSALAAESERDSNPKVAGLSSGHVAYVIYTSGSTGEPKGVIVEHCGLVNLAQVHRHQFEIYPESHLVQFASVCFDASVWEVLMALEAGATLHVPTVDERISRAELMGFLADATITHALFPPAFLQASSDLEWLRSVETLILGGEAPSVDLINTLQANAQIFNAYGPTEATVCTTTWSCGKDFDGRIVPIGRPIANARVYVLDGYGEPVPRGTVGELYVGGAGVARGYLNRPELTSERFVADPYSPEPGTRMYRTGDLGRYQPDGNLEFLGRRDHQVKVRGFRIELGEIEARLLEHASVRDAVVVSREGVEGDRRLVAYVTMRPEEGAASEVVSTLRSHLGRQLPEYMVPSAFVRLKELPLTRNGKLDRKALPAPDGESVVKRRYEAPQGEIEETLSRLWSELLGVERVGRQDHFFELGGHSLLAVRLLSRMREALQVELPLTRLFGEPTLAGQGEAIAAIVERRGVQALPAIGRVSRAGPLLMSFGQQRLWFLAKLGASATYHIPMVLRVRGLLEASALRKSLDRLVWRHESLRSVFLTEDGEPRVKLLPAESGFALVEEDVEDAPDAGEQLEAMSREEAEAPFDLERGPLLRGRLIRLGPEEHVLLLTQHHIVSDGWSMGVFTRELGALYEAYASGKEDPLPALEIQYPDYAAWQRAWLTGERLEAQAAYWRENLSGAPERLELPTDRPRPKEQSFVGGFVGLRLDRELTRGLKRVSQEQGGTLLMTVLSAWSMVLSRLSGQEEVVIGIPTANRGRREVEGLIGFFVNTLALRIDVSGEPSVVELVSRVRKTALLAQEHQDLPFEQVVEIVSPPRRLDQSPVFQVMCTVEQGEGGGFALGGLKVEPAGAPLETVKFDVELSLRELDGIIVGGLRYARALFDGGTIERHGGYLEAALRALVRDPGRRVGEVELLSPRERKLLLETWNETAAAYPRERCIHELFEEQVRRSPEAVALVQGEEEVTYGELNRRANRLAHRLIEHGVGPDVRVVLCVERSPSMVVALLGILKAGGAYVPLDPSYPGARLLELVEDAAPLLAVCDAAGCEKVGEDSAGVPILVLEDTHVEPGAELETDPTVASLTSAHLAYVIYTSGSSGKPKAVLVEHRGVMNYVVWARAAYAPEAGGVVTSSLSFDATVTSLIIPLVCGSAVRLMASVEDADGLHAELHGMDGWLVKMTPSHLGSLGQVLAGKSSAISLGVVVIGGEALSSSITRTWRQIQPGVRLVNEYGPTETVVGCSVYEVPERIEDGGTIPIGRPIANARIYVLDGYGEPVPQGAVGEIHIGGAGVARGYLNRPELTSERFVADPHSPEPGARMYRTGDLGRYQPDGNLEFLGRWDHQVKVRGYRIELGEIEARLLEHRLVREAVVIAREGAEGDKRLVAYITMRPEEGEGAASEVVSTLRSHLARQLPEYMVPSAFVRLEELPLTRNGKLDRKALPTPDGKSVVSRSYEAPQGEIEETLARFWSELLGVERVGRQDDFFELGGHSLLAVTLLQQLRRIGLGTEIRILFATPTLSGFAATLGSEREVAAPTNQITPETQSITPSDLPLIALTQADIDRIVAQVPGGIGNIQDIYALAPLQEGILFHHLLASEGDPYLLMIQMAFPGRALLERYLAAVQRVVDRHDILRTSFVWEGQSQAAQVVWRRAPLVVTEVELEGEGESGIEELARRFDPRKHRIELTHAPLLRFVVGKERGSERWLVLELLHHLIGDHSTLEMLHAEVDAFLRGLDE